MLDPAWKGPVCTLAQQTVLTILLQMEVEAAMGQWPSVLAVEAQRAHV